MAVVVAVCVVVCVVVSVVVAVVVSVVVSRPGSIASCTKIGSATLTEMEPLVNITCTTPGTLSSRAAKGLAEARSNMVAPP